MRTQADIINRIGCDIFQWLQILWTVGVEDGTEIRLVQKGLKLCESTLSAVRVICSQ
jgi:hypothetical protein